MIFLGDSSLSNLAKVFMDDDPQVDVLKHAGRTPVINIYGGKKTDTLKTLR